MTYLRLKVDPHTQITITIWMKVKMWEKMLMVWDYKLNLFANLISYYKINLLIYFKMILNCLLKLISDFSKHD